MHVPYAYGMDASRWQQQACVWNAASGGRCVREHGERCDLIEITAPDGLRVQLATMLRMHAACQLTRGRRDVRVRPRWQSRVTRSAALSVQWGRGPWHRSAASTVGRPHGPAVLYKYSTQSSAWAKPATCTVRSRRHGHSKASARAIRAGLDITAQGGWRCTCLHKSGSKSDSVPALSPIRSYSLDASLAYCALPLLFDRTCAASGYSTSRATSSRARWNSYATAKHSTPVPAAAFFYFTQGAWRFHPRCGPGASLLPLSHPTVAELLLLPPQFVLPAIRRAQWALHVTSTRSFLLPLSQPTVAKLLPPGPHFVLPAIRRAQWALHVTSVLDQGCQGVSGSIRNQDQEWGYQGSLISGSRVKSGSGQLPAASPGQYLAYPNTRPALFVLIRRRAMPAGSRSAAQSAGGRKKDEIWDLVKKTSKR